MANTYQKTAAYQKHVAQRRVSKPIRIKKNPKSYQNVSKRFKTYQKQNHNVAIEIPFFMIIMLIMLVMRNHRPPPASSAQPLFPHPHAVAVDYRNHHRHYHHHQQIVSPLIIGPPLQVPEWLDPPSF